MRGQKIQDLLTITHYSWQYLTIKSRASPKDEDVSTARKPQIIPATPLFFDNCCLHRRQACTSAHEIRLLDHHGFSVSTHDKCIHEWFLNIGIF